MKLMEKKKIIVLYPCTGDKSYDDGYFYGAKEVMDIINNAPIIKAIPVTWLEERREDMENAEQDFPEQAIRYVLWLWEKYKEA